MEAVSSRREVFKKERGEMEEKKFVVIRKNNGKFCSAFNEDAYIIGYLCDYKVLENRKVGFPDSALTKVINKLEDEKISYQIIYLDKDPLIKDYKKLNKYNLVKEKALHRLDYVNKVNMIIEKIKKMSEEEFSEFLDRAIDVSNN